MKEGELLPDSPNCYPYGLEKSHEADIREAFLAYLSRSTPAVPSVRWYPMTTPLCIH